MTKKRSFAFKKGWNQLPLAETKKVRDEIIKELGLRYRTSFYQRLNGAVEPKVTEAEAIERIFKKRGIKNIWGDE